LNLTIGELVTICVVSTSHMISLSHKWDVSFSNLEAIDKFVDSSSSENDFTIVVAATIIHRGGHGSVNLKNRTEPN